jgi:hypothetical protein
VTGEKAVVEKVAESGAHEVPAALEARERKKTGDADGRLVTREEKGPERRPRSREKAHEAGLVPPSEGPQKMVTEVGALPEEERLPARSAEKALISEAGELAMTGRAATGVEKVADSGAHTLPASLEAKTRKK